MLRKIDIDKLTEKELKQFIEDLKYYQDHLSNNCDCRVEYKVINEIAFRVHSCGLGLRIAREKRPHRVPGGEWRVS